MKLLKIKRGDYKPTVVWDVVPRIGAGHRMGDDPQNPQAIPFGPDSNMWLELTREEIQQIAKLERVLQAQEEWAKEHVK